MYTYCLTYFLSSTPMLILYPQRSIELTYLALLFVASRSLQWAELSTYTPASSPEISLGITSMTCPTRCFWQNSDKYAEVKGLLKQAYASFRQVS